ncbi:AraC family transcriptional regulator [Halomonas sp. 18H]|uniref:AraC family transcriptional regulator n=1 Tax=Halomonas almeriensis TaxID=308163 RepID=UPI00222F9E8A|nr:MULTISPECIES: AraC family transcriptional regulator [Halomonas]MCW4153344.1 AraC family transcriptional regulator [Halomonas sp. 18H]MDN3553771.1 AraC family transcriptional regulator [Halomonas almeriensis]
MTVSAPSTCPLIELITPLVERDGYISTSLPSVTLMASRRPVPRTPLIYDPSLIIVAQGHKVGHLGDREIHYGPGQYLVQTLPLPFECETQASEEAPLLGVAVRFDPALLGELVAAMGEPATAEVAPVPMDSVSMSPGMQAAVERLLRTLHDSAETTAMGEARVRDVVFEALKGEQGAAMRALVHHDGHYSRIVEVLSWLHEHYAADVSVDALAAQASMSLSTFHQHFKQVTQASPLQYLKRLRLIKAQQLLVQEACNVNQAAEAVGYRSVSQFSRDYKRCFGNTPLKHRQEERALQLP